MQNLDSFLLCFVFQIQNEKTVLYFLLPNLKNVEFQKYCRRTNNQPEISLLLCYCEEYMLLIWLTITNWDFCCCQHSCLLNNFFFLTSVNPYMLRNGQLSIILGKKKVVRSLKSLVTSKGWILISCFWKVCYGCVKSVNCTESQVKVCRNSELFFWFFCNLIIISKKNLKCLSYFISYKIISVLQNGEKWFVCCQGQAEILLNLDVLVYYYLPEELRVDAISYEDDEITVRICLVAWFTFSLLYVSLCA